MLVYDDMTEGVFSSGKQLILSAVDTSEDVTFKASFIILSDLHCKGKITALFDLFVFGNIEADEIDIKGRFICLGKCIVNGSLIVQTDIWAEDIQATSVTCHDQIIAQSIDAESVHAERNIIIGKTLAIEEKAETLQNIICGETAFGAGRIIASKVLTTDPLDLDEGTEAIESPFTYFPSQGASGDIDLAKEVSKYAISNDYSAFLDKLSSIPTESETTIKYKRYLSVLKAVEEAYPAAIANLTDVSILLWLIEIVHDDYFKDWTVIGQWMDCVRKHFEDMAEGKYYFTDPGKPADKLEKGYTVSHSKYGYGMVEDIIKSQTGEKTIKIAIVVFNDYGKKKFTLPDSLKFFQIISEMPSPSKEEVRSSITCQIDSYSDWLAALTLSHANKEYLGNDLYDIIFELLLEKIGLKAKFIGARFKEKGWA